MAIRYRVDHQMSRGKAAWFDVTFLIILGIHFLAAIGMGIALTLVTG